MMRLLCVAALTVTLAACQTFESGPDHNTPDNEDELTHLLVFHQTLDQLSDAELAFATDQARNQLQQDTRALPEAQLKLLMLESHRQLRELQQILESQLQQIEALNTQIEALTAIEQQINRRGQLQESENE